MVRRYFWLILTILGLTAVSCSPSTVDVQPTNVDNIDGGSGLNVAPEANPDIFPRSTLTPPPVSDPIDPEGTPGGQQGYPAPPTPEFPEGYEMPTSPPVLNSYPEPTGHFIWILKPVGEQCAEAPTTSDLQTAVAEMIALGIPVEASEMTSLNVCAACGCPTSAHFRLQVDAAYLDNAEQLGWFAEE